MIKRLSVLDQSTTSKGREQDLAIRESMDLARHCEALGYHRYWVSEHHSSGSIVGTAPEVLMAAIAATTTTIRVGSAGVMLPHYSALKVAEQFRVLEGIAPGRIDLGLGRAPGTDQLTSIALNPHPGNVHEEFPRQVRDLQYWVSGTPLPEDHPFHRIRAQPEGPTAPEMWILGSSEYGAQLAGYFGLPYAFAYFFSEDANVDEVLRLYRDNFRPSPRFPEPIATICVWALAADTEEEARFQSKSREYSRLGFERGIRGPLLPPEEVAAYEYTPAELVTVERFRRKALVGTGEQVAAKLNELAERMQAFEELVIVTWTYDTGPRKRSYELLAQQFGLQARKA